LSRPCGQRIRFVVVQHVPHGKGQRIQVILYTKKLQRILPVAVNKIVLKVTKALDLSSDVRRICDHCRQGDDQAHKQPGGGRTSQMEHIFLVTSIHRCLWAKKRGKFCFLLPGGWDMREKVLNLSWRLCDEFYLLAWLLFSVSFPRGL